MSDNVMSGFQRMGILRAIVWKELRERLKVAFVCLVMVVAGLLFSLGFQRMLSLAGVQTEVSPFTFTFFTLTSVRQACAWPVFSQNAVWVL